MDKKGIFQPQQKAEHGWENVPSRAEWVQVAKALASREEGVGIPFQSQSQVGSHSLNPQSCKKEAVSQGVEWTEASWPWAEEQEGGMEERQQV